jgi:hypothetical protein
MSDTRATLTADGGGNVGPPNNAAAAQGPWSERLARWWTATESLLVRAGDRLNPILVKETRQALKSRQFVLTFSLVLIAVWVWTVAALTWIGPEIWYGAHGRDLFMGYFVILCFPLTVVVPFSALRSLAGEHEERTCDLLSITTLRPRQIVGGKLGSAALQVLVYLSAVAPCLAFTYLLRGIDVLSIVVLVAGVSLASLGLAVIALLIGTLASEKHWQIVLGIGAVIGLFYAFGGSIALGAVALWEEPGVFGEPYFWPAALCMLTAFASYLALAFLAAAARLTFAGANRSTPVRMVMLVQQMLFVGWFAWFAARESKIPDWPEITAVCLVIVGIHWCVMGAMMTGESPELSPRVKRNLPQSLLGRAFLTWFNPGPGTGYVFAVCGFAAAAVLAATVFSLGLLADHSRWQTLPVRIPGAFPAGATPVRQDIAWTVSLFAIILLSYLTLYLGLGLLLLRLLRRMVRVSIPGALLVHVLLAVLGAFVPMVIQQVFGNPRYGEWSFLQITNAPWTLTYLFDRVFRPMPSTDANAVAMMLAGLALVVFVLNLPGISREVRQVRVEKPRRVADDDAAMAPPPEPKPTSPWG